MILPVLTFVFALVLEPLFKPGLKYGNKGNKNAQKCSKFQKCQFVTKVPYIVTKVPYSYKSALSRVTKVPYDVTKVP